jgi:UV DNA damage repair endonuclease
MVGNIEATRKLVERVSTLDAPLRMVRISSDILPAYTHADFASYWRKPDVVSYCETHFKRVGNIARNSNVRLSMHPGQFTVLASDNPGIVGRSIDEFEYHADIARYMGYGKAFQDFKINVHISGKQGPQGIRNAYGKLTPEARNCITIENEENSWGLNDCLTISDIIPIVLDVHHHFVREGEYIQPTDSRVLAVIDSWRGIRPTFHYSQSRENWLVGHDAHILPDMKKLLESGHKKQKLRAHSDFMWNIACNEWALKHLEWGDMMVECKSKNLGAHQLFKFWKSL